MKHLIFCKTINGNHLLMALIVLFLGLFNLFFGEIVPAGSGFGWDGTIYAYMTRHLGSIVGNGELSPAYAVRILAPGIAHAMLKVSGAAFTDLNVIRVFAIYNLALLLAANWLWKRVSDASSLSVKGRWVGFAGLFLSFMGSKFAFYYPVLTDVTGLFLGLLMLSLYLEKRLFPLFFVTLIGAFAWPLVGICGAMLMVFMWSKPFVDTITPQAPGSLITNTELWRRTQLGWIIIFLLCFTGVIFLMVIDTYPGTIRLFSASALSWQRRLTNLPSLVGVLIALFVLAGSVPYLRSVLVDVRNTKMTSWILAVFAVLIPWIIIRIISSHYIVNDQIPNPYVNRLHVLTGMCPPGKFLLPLVSLAVYWGPVVLLILLTWKTFCREARALGFGFVAVVAFILPLALPTEPRYISFGWPYFVLGAALALERTEKTKAFWTAFIILVLLYGQFWMKINLAPWSANAYEALLDYPKQLYFMHFGPWMSWWSYSLQLVAVILSAWWLRTTISVSPAVSARGVVDVSSTL